MKQYIINQPQTEQQNSKPVVPPPPQPPTPPSPTINKQSQQHDDAWQCPCGEVTYGPYHYFSHIKQAHPSDTLADLHLRNIIKKVIRKDPSVTISDLAIMEQAEDMDFSRRVRRIARKYKHILGGSVPTKQSSNGDTRVKSYQTAKQLFMRQTSLSHQASKQILQIFFDFVEKQIVTIQGPDAWKKGSTRQLPKKFKQILNNFMQNGQQNPLSIMDFRQLLFTWCKWLLIQGWTGIRIYKRLQQYPQKYQDEVKEQSMDDQQQGQNGSKKVKMEQMPGRRNTVKMQE